MRKNQVLVWRKSLQWAHGVLSLSWNKAVSCSSSLFICSHATDSEKEPSTTVLWPWQSSINLEMSEIVLVNLLLLGLVKHNPDPQWNMERKQYEVERIPVPQKLKIQRTLTERQPTADLKTAGNPMHISWQLLSNMHTGFDFIRLRLLEVQVSLFFPFLPSNQSKDASERQIFLVLLKMWISEQLQASSALI